MKITNPLIDKLLRILPEKANGKDSWNIPEALDTRADTWNAAISEMEKNLRALNLDEWTAELLTDYSDWLHKHGYIDADYYAEEPKAVDAYLDSLHK